MLKENFFIIGKHSVEEAVKQNLYIIKNLFLSEDLNFNIKSNFLKLRNKFKIDIIKRHLLTQLVKTSKHQGMAIYVSIKNELYSSFQNFINEIKRNNTPRLILVIVNLQDPNNLGAIIRTASAFESQCIIITKHKSCSITPAVTKIASGSLYKTKLIEITNVNNTLKILKKIGFWILGTTITNKALPPWKINLTMPLCLVIGGEHKGVSKNILKSCDIITNIPIKNIESLNVSVATGIILFEITRQCSLKSII